MMLEKLIRVSFFLFGVCNIFMDRFRNVNFDDCLMVSGRGSSTPSVDMFITLLSLGQFGYTKLLKQRKEIMEYLRSKLSEMAEKHGERLLNTKSNPISMGTFSRLVGTIS